MKEEGAGHGRFILLDGLRGVAAIIVLIFHIIQQHTAASLPYAVLAVDFFYVLSGFVIAHAYENRILAGKMRAAEFIEIRIKRLYPLIFLSTSIGILTALLALIVKQSISISQLYEVSILGLLVLPSFVFPEWSTAYPLNMGAWSLTFEGFVNLFYILIAKKLNNKVLFSVLILSWVSLLVQAISVHGIYGGNNQQGWCLGFIRVTFPFFAGILVYRLKGEPRGNTASGLALVLILAATLLVRWPNYTVSSLICVSVVFPSVVYFGARVNISGVASAVLQAIGVMSYPIYIMQGPILRIGEEIIKHINSSKISILFSAFEFFAILLIAYGAIKYFDEPIQNLFKNRKKRLAQYSAGVSQVS
jgi:peptidoglycan/LPS O-acetylase OafA/YrhL